MNVLSLVGAVGMVAVLSACGDDGDSGNGGAGNTGTGNAGATATGGNSTGGSVSTGGGGAEGGMGGGGGQPAGCDPYDPQACDMGQVCLVVDETLGLNGGTACAAPGTKPVFAACAGNGECVAGAFCDRLTATCKPLCENSGDCPDDGACTPAQTAAGAEIPGLKLCVAECEPVLTTGCDDTEGPVNCTWREDLGSFDCFSAGTKGEGMACAEQAECDVGLGCLEVNGNFGCLPWCVYDGGTDICTNAEHPNAQFAICVPQIPGISSSGTDYGGCLKQL